MCATWKFELKKHLCEKRGQLLKKVSKYQNIKIANNSSIKWGSWTCVVTYWFEKIMDVSTFVLYFQFEIFCRLWFKFLIGNFTVVLIRIFFPDWEPEFLKQLGPQRYFSGNLWNWWKNKSALGTKYLHRRNFFNWVKICWENENVTAWSQGYVTLLLDMWLLIISHPSVNFDSHRSRENEFITFFICYMTLYDHVINRLCYFVDNKPVLEPTNLSNFLATVLSEVEI